MTSTITTAARPFAVVFIEETYRVRLHRRYDRRDSATAALRPFAARGQVAVLVRIDPAGAIVVLKVVNTWKWLVTTDPRTMYAIGRAVAAKN